MKHRIATDNMAREFRLLRNRIEAEIHAPAVLLVTSATERDGAGLTAYGLAESLSKTHQRTALLTTSAMMNVPDWSMPASPSMRRRASDRLEAGKIEVEGGLSIVSVSPERLATISRSSIATLVQGLRTEHDYVVIDGGGLPDNTFGLLLLASADAVLVSFLSGRQLLPADRSMLDTLEKSEAKMLGVVMNEQLAIDHFNDTVPKKEPGVAHVTVNDTVPKKEPGVAHVTVTEQAPMALGQRFEVALQRIGKSF